MVKSLLVQAIRNAFENSGLSFKQLLANIFKHFTSLFPFISWLLLELDNHGSWVQYLTIDSLLKFTCLARFFDKFFIFGVNSLFKTQNLMLLVPFLLVYQALYTEKHKLICTEGLNFLFMGLTKTSCAIHFKVHGQFLLLDRFKVKRGWLIE